MIKARGPVPVRFFGMVFKLYSSVSDHPTTYLPSAVISSALAFLNLASSPFLERLPILMSLSLDKS